MGDARKRKIDMSAKTLIIATAALAACTAMTLPAFAAGGDGTGPTPADKPPIAAPTVPARATIMFNLLDTNHDGAVDKDEFAVLSNATFEALDTNHDGKLTPDELRGRFGAVLGERGGRAGPGMGWDRDGRGGRGMMGRMGFDGPRGAGPRGAGPLGLGPRLTFNDIDTNHDGVISADEFAAHMPGPGYGPRR